MGFPGSWAGKESACSAGDPGSIPGSGRPPGERTGYPLQSSGASLVAQTVKNMPAMQETWVRSLGWEDPLEEGMEAHFYILAWRIPMKRSLVGYSPRGHKESDTTERLSTEHTQHNIANVLHRHGIISWMIRCGYALSKMHMWYRPSYLKAETETHIENKYVDTNGGLGWIGGLTLTHIHYWYYVENRC